MIKVQQTTFRGDGGEIFKGLSTIAGIMLDEVTKLQVLVFIRLPQCDGMYLIFKRTIC